MEFEGTHRKVQSQGGQFDCLLFGESSHLAAWSFLLVISECR